MIYGIAYTKAANADLREIAAYYRKTAGDDIAERLVGEIVNAVEKLAIRPTLLRERHELGRGLRGLGVRNHLIFYRVEPDVVRIVRVLHGSRNITANMFR